MYYHNILHDDMRNGDGLRVVLFVSGCQFNCPGCQNPQTWELKSGIQFDEEAKKEIFEQLEKDYISGITFSGGDPLNIENAETVRKLIEEIKDKYPDKSIWVYTGDTWEGINSLMSTHYFAPCKESYYCIDLTKIIHRIDVLVDGKFEIENLDVNYPWAGSTNQRVINVPASLRERKVVLWT